MAHPEVRAEQAHVDHAYARLEEMRAAVAGMLRDAFGERGGTFQALTERDIRVRTSLGRLEQLQIGGAALVFGRIDRRDGDGGTEAFHIGRLAISDADQEPLVVDWRAPVAEPFYRATGAQPMNLRRRRHFLSEGRRVLDLEDELFGADGDGQDGGGLGLSGSQVLLAALERSRTGRMRDIVATVQREQDEIIRSPLGGVLVVQGGPGTGKTAVALHRAAYLLYTHRFPLERQGVLVVGPNPTFLRYIERVLPSLGETGVELSTVTGLLGPISTPGVEDGDTARLKGDARAAKLLARAVGDRQRALRRTAAIPFGRAVLRLTPVASGQIVAAVKRRPGTHNARRRAVELLVWRHLLGQVEAGADVPGRPPRAPGSEEPLTPVELGQALRHVPEAAEALDRMWPLLTPQAFLHDLLGAPALLRLAGGELMGEEELALLHRPRSSSPVEVAWTEADVPLLDEAKALLGPVRRRPAPGDEEIRAYGHVVVDEAQDLSPMQLRMLARRSLSGSMTVVGDLAQATGGWAPSSWAEVVEHLPARRGWRRSELTVNYRTPAEIMRVASRILARAAPGTTPPESVRAGGQEPEVVSVEGGGPFASSRLPGEVARVVARELARVRAGAPGDAAGGAGGAGVGAAGAGGGGGAGVGAAGAGGGGGAGAADEVGTVGVLVPASLLRPITEALVRAGIPFGRAAAGALDEPVSLLTVADAKGLEFDAVVVAEPVRIVAESRQGLRALYVAISRATQRLVAVHAEALPEGVFGAGAASLA